jgi:hypothetical protein
LQSQINTEKGRIDAILSASEADKDSFAEIVQLINSVDTTNDQAFAGYVASNDAALAQEVSDRQSGDSALSGRLDVLESDPVTKTYVDGLDSAMDSRMDVLEADPTTKSYVDGEVDALEAEDLTMFKLDGTRAISGKLEFQGSLIVKSLHGQTGTSDVIQAGTNDYYIGVDCSLASKTVQLPAPVAGKKIIVKDESGNAQSNNIMVEYPSGTIDGNASFSLTANYESACFISDGTNWFVI